MKFKKPGRPFLLFVLPMIILSVLLISYLRLTDNYELETLDYRFLLRPSQAATDKVVLIEIGDDTLKNLGRWPLDRSYHALLVKALSGAGARAILFDMFFSEPREYDGEFENAIRDAGNVYIPFVFDLDAEKKSHYTSAKGYIAKNLPDISAAAKEEGHINIFPDIDGKFRRVPLLIKYNDTWYPYISFLVACDYLDIPVKDAKIIPGKYISFGDMKIPLEDSSNMIINFSGRWGKTYKHYSYSDVIQSYLAPTIGQKPILDLNIFKDKVCVIGLTAAGTVDLHPNPFETLYPGFGIHAEIFNSMLNRRFIARASKEINLIILIVLMVLITITTLKTKPIKGFFILIAASIAFIFTGMLLFIVSRLWIDLFYPALILVLLYLSLTLYKYISEWKKRLLMENELSIAKKIQESFLPKRLPEISGINMAAAMFTARQVGGDLYDFKVFDSGRFGVMIGDVSGKGVPASLFMAMVTGAFKSFAVAGAMPQDVLANLNTKLVKESASDLFVTMFYSVFDLNNGRFEYANGGHLPVLHLSEENKHEFLDVENGAPLGLMDNTYSGAQINFNKGDLFIFYTDGVTEAMNAKRDMYEKERLVNVAKKNRHKPSRYILEAIEKDIRKFEPKPIQHDDITLIVVKIA